MNNAQQTKPALILNELTLAHLDREGFEGYARRIGESWKETRDYEGLSERYSYLCHYARITFGAKALPVLCAMGRALDEGRGL